MLNFFMAFSLIEDQIYGNFPRFKNVTHKKEPQLEGPWG